VALPAGLPVAVGWHDGAAATLGSGAAAGGTAPITLGTNAVYRVVTTAIPAPLRKSWDLTPGLTVTGGDILAAGRAWAWAVSLFPGATISASTPGANGAIFLPQLSGRIAPGVNPSARAAWHGLDGNQAPADLLRAVGEGIAFSLRQVRDWLQANGLTAIRTVATGGGAHDPAQAQLLADVLQQSVLVATCEEGCRGAALLGAVAAGLMTIEEARTLLPRYVRYAPNAALAPVYDDGYARFLACQEATDRAWPPD
jgi:xylulokinase